MEKKKKTYRLETPTESPDRDYTEYYARLAKIKKGDYVKLLFTSNDKYRESEGMWVKVTAFKGERFIGTLSNDPCCIKLKWGDKIRFKSKHIKWIEFSEETAARGKRKEEQNSEAAKKNEDEIPNEE